MDGYRNPNSPLVSFHLSFALSPLYNFVDQAKFVSNSPSVWIDEDSLRVHGNLAGLCKDKVLRVMQYPLFVHRFFAD